jgi:acetyl esterase/lipase
MPANANGVAIRREAMHKWEQAGVDALGAPPKGLGEHWHEIRFPGGWVSQTLFVYPTSGLPKDGKCPLIVYLHGGGFAYGEPGQILLPARGYANQFKAVVACPTYMLSPENAFPHGVQSAWEVTSWISNANNVNNGPLKDVEAKVDPSQGFVVGGLSAGANMAAVFGGIQALPHDSQQYVLRGLTPMSANITGIFAGIPAILQEIMVPEQYADMFGSRMENSNGGAYGLLLDTRTVRDIERMLAADYHSVWWSPVNIDFSNPELGKRHPPRVFIHGSGLCPLRDDAIIYDKWLQETVGCESRCTIVENFGHAGWASPDFEGSRRAQMREMSLEAMGWLLGKEWKKSRGLY